MHKFVARTPSTRRLLDCLICAQASTHPLHSLIREHSTQEFDLGLHVRHRRSQPLDFVDRHAANCAAKALSGVAAPVIFVATDRPSRLRGLFTKIEEALGRRCSFKFLNASQLAPDVRLRLHSIARTDERAVQMGRDLSLIHI